MSNLSLFLLGSPQIERDGVLISTTNNKAMALLIYLAVMGEPQRRDTLATLLWPESSQRIARSSLRRDLSVLKKVLVDDFVIADRETISTSTDIWLDLNEFENYFSEFKHGKSATVRTLRKAVDLYRGDFLLGFTLPNCSEFDDWQFLQTEKFRDQFAQCLQILATKLIHQQDYETAIPYARRWLSLDSLHEPAHQMLMRLYAFSGRQAAALRQYSECYQLLDDELGIEPDAETQNLEAAIRARKFKSPAKQSIIFAHPMSESETRIWEQDAEPRPLFIGREQQLSNIRTALEKTLKLQGQLRLITGEAGAGKSALISEFIYRMQPAQYEMLVATGYCDAQTGTIDPYLPFRDVFQLLLINPETKKNIRALAATTLLEHGTQLFQVVVPTTEAENVIKTARNAGWTGDIPQVSSQNIEQSKIIEQAVTVLQQIATHFPIFLILEDLHWADSGSVGILFRLARQLKQHRILVIGSYRPEALQADTQSETHPLKKAILELQRNMHNVFIDLEQARHGEGMLLVNGILDAEPNKIDRNFREALFRQTDGHPLFVVELVHELKENGFLIRNDAEQWVMTSDMDWLSLPTRVEGAIAGRMAHLSEKHRWFLSIASVLGESFLVEVVARVADEDPTELARILSRTLQAEHRLVEAEGVERINKQRLTSYRFRHNLMQVYLYERLDDVQKIYLHEDVARTLETLYGGELERISLTLAYHYQASGLFEQAIDYLILGSARSIQVVAYEEAVQHLSRALDLLEELPPDETRDQKELKIQTQMGQCWTAQKGATVPEVGVAYTRALELSYRLGATRETVELLFALTQYSQMRMEFAQAKNYGEESLRLAKDIDDPELQMQVNKILHNIAHSEGRHLAATKYNGAIIAYYNNYSASLTPEDNIHLAYAYSKQGINLVPSGYPQQALDHARKGLELMKRYGAPLNIGASMSFLGYVHLMRRDWQDVLDWTEPALEIVTQHNMPQGITFNGMLRGVALAHLGDFEAGKKVVMDAITERRRINSPYGELWALARLFEVSAKHGQLQDGLNIIDEVLSRINETNERETEPELYHIKGVLLLEQNLNGADLLKIQKEAESCFRQSVAISQNRGTKLWELRALSYLCRLLHTQGRDEGCHQQLRDLCAWFTEGFDTEDLRFARTVLKELA